MKPPTPTKTGHPDEPIDNDLLNDALLQQINTELDQQPIHSATLSRIRRGRETALAAYDQRQAGPLAAMRRLVPAINIKTIASIALFAFALVFTLRPDPSSNRAAPQQWQAAQITDIELLSGPEEPAMFTELEFYFWLEEGADSGVAG